MLVLQPPHFECLHVGQDLGHHALDACLPCNRRRRLPVVAADHHNRDTQITKCRNRCHRVVLDCVGDSDKACQLAIHHCANRGLAVCREPPCDLRESVPGDAGVLDESLVTDQDLPSIDSGSDTFSGHRLEVSRLKRLKAARFGTRDDCRS